MSTPGRSPLDTVEVDSHISATLDKVAEEFPSALTAIASHMTFVRAHAVYAAALAKLYERLDLSVPRFNMLWLLYRTNKGQLTISELAAQLGLKIPSVMRMVQALESEGWLTTSRDIADKRVRLVELTDHGHERVSSILPSAFDIWAQLWEGTSAEELPVLIRLLGNLRKSLLQKYIGEENLATFRTGELLRADESERLELEPITNDRAQTPTQ